MGTASTNPNANSSFVSIFCGSSSHNMSSGGSTGAGLFGPSTGGSGGGSGGGLFSANQAEDIERKLSEKMAQKWQHVDSKIEQLISNNARVDQKVDQLVQQTKQAREEQDQKFHDKIEFIMERAFEKLMDESKGPVAVQVKAIKDRIVQQNKPLKEGLIELNNKVEKMQEQEKKKGDEIRKSYDKMQQEILRLDGKVGTIQTEGLGAALQTEMKDTLTTLKEQQDHLARQKSEVEEAKRKLEESAANQKEEFKKLCKEGSIGAGGGGGDRMLTKDELTRIWDQDRKNADLKVGDTIIIHGLNGKTHQERVTFIFNQLKSTLPVADLPAVTDLSTPRTRTGNEAPISFLKLKDFDTRKKAATSINQLPKTGARVTYSAATDRINRYMINAAKDAGVVLGISGEEAKKKIRIDFRRYEVSCDGAVFLKRDHTDVFIWTNEEKFKEGENARKIRTGS